MSISISNNPITNLFNKTTNAIAPQAATTSNTPAISNDAVKLSNTYTAPSDAGTWKKISNSVGEMFSNVADKMHVGETYKLVSQEFDRSDYNKDEMLNVGEFNVATLNLTDIFGTEFARADQNRDGRINRSEYVDYRKQQLSNVFEAKDKSMDNHLNVNEIGFIGKQLLANRDPRLDENQDGLVNKREFTRSVVRGSMSIRDFFGI